MFAINLNTSHISRDSVTVSIHKMEEREYVREKMHQRMKGLEGRGIFQDFIIVNCTQVARDICDNVDKYGYVISTACLLLIQPAPLRIFV